jgi:proteasome assembly chaperone (PAC2) family protein
MDSVRQFHVPRLRKPVAVIAFEGWNDACEAASAAATYTLHAGKRTEPFAVIDPDEFYDFQQHRPIITSSDGGHRSLSWPITRFHGVKIPDHAQDLIVVTGDEPSFRWRTYARLITSVLADHDVEQVILLGAFIGQVAHRRPTPIIGVATEPERVERFDLHASDYQGPTGIVSVVMEACREAGIPAMSLWAATPHYLAASPNPKAMLALLTKTAEITGLPLDLSDLDNVVEQYLDKVENAIEASTDLNDYITDLEREDAIPDLAEASSGGDTDDLFDEIETFLRQNPDSSR